MKRRDFFHHLSADALLAFGIAQAAASQNTPAPPVKKLKVDAYSRHLQWLRTADEVAEATLEMGFDGVDLTVRPYPGHVDPEKVAQDLPPFVNTIRKHGLQVVTITCPITDAESPNAERILQTASSLGITHYWWGTFRYAQDKPVMEQLEALKPRVAKLAALNAKYKMTAMYHTYSGAGTVGAAIWDFLYVLRNFDPAQVGFHYDIGHMTNAGGNGTWALNLRAAGPYIAGVSAKDSVMEQNLDVRGGGPLTPETAALMAASGGGRGRGGPGGPGGPGAPDGAPGGSSPGSGRGARGQQSDSTGAAAGGGGQPGGRGAGVSADAASARGGDAARGGRGGGGRGAGGRGGGAGANASIPPWRVRQAPLGTGMDDLPLFASVLKEIGFFGPIEIQAEYPNGGANNAADKITLPRAQVLGAMKRDLLALRAAFEPSGLL
jgi:sugar phosphate isomerase/epimerase